MSIRAMAEIEIKSIIKLPCILEQEFLSFSVKATKITLFQNNQSQKEKNNHNP